LHLNSRGEKNYKIEGDGISEKFKARALDPERPV
jgi:hypothetical protein